MQAEPSAHKRDASAPIDRDSENDVASIIEDLYPDPSERRGCVAEVAATIKLVADRPPELWSITLGPHLVRLNVGRLACVSLTPLKITEIVDGNAVSEDLRTSLMASGGSFEGGLQTLPDAVWISLPSSQFGRFQTELSAAHAAAVHSAARQVQRCPYLSAHSPAVVTYLNQVLGEKLVGPQVDRRTVPSLATTLSNALAKWDRSAAASRVEAGERERESVIAAFPRDAWPTLPLERYALGGGPDTYCYLMEYKTLEVGSIKGGAARKHLIYKHASAPGWYFDGAYRDEHEAWDAVRSGFVEAFGLIEQGDYAAADAISALRSGAALRAKSAFVYFPDRFLPIYSLTHLAHFASLLGSPIAGLDSVAANRHLRELVDARSEFSGWSPLEVMHFLYNWADPREARRIVKIAPGERARYWDDCRSGGYICVGWDEIGDLTRFAGQDEFTAAFIAQYSDPSRGNQGAATRKARELWTLMELEPGDIVLANRGISEILAVGTVNSRGYEWQPHRAEYKHTLGVDWDEAVARHIEPIPRWATTTVAPVPAALYRQLFAENPELPVDAVLTNLAEAIERKGQVIVYGPPGTGKTYTARRFSVWWLRHKAGSPDAASVLDDVDLLASHEADLEKAGQLQKVTFHPSYAYEDFIEGFKPIPSADSGLHLALKDGVFKELCAKADADPDRPYLLVIDEINRGNIPKIFGELITLLEVDKREQSLRLPQSGSWFSVPKNVYLVGTMNTADRSIRLLDTALRRRFAFTELMPDLSLLANSLVGPLALDDFLKELNRRIARSVGREKQIGHAYLMAGTEAITTASDFAARFRQDIIPLLQEYAYDDYGVLADYLGPAIVDTETLEWRSDVLDDPDQLVAVLHEAFADTEDG